jgi:hypothetical protein
MQKKIYIYNFKIKNKIITKIPNKKRQLIQKSLFKKKERKKCH